MNPYLTQLHPKSTFSERALELMVLDGKLNLERMQSGVRKLE